MNNNLPQGTLKKILFFLNSIVPKREKVMITCMPNVESNVVEVANYIKENYNMPVYYGISSLLKDSPKKVLHPGIKVFEKDGSIWKQVIFRWRFMRSKYLFFTHGGLFYTFPKNQIAVNIWHGVLYKNVGVLDGKTGTLADITVSTSPNTNRMFADAFGVPIENVFVSGYPRNDALLRTKKNKEEVRKIVSEHKFDRIIMWLPTYRKRTAFSPREDGVETGNPFYIEDFDMDRFNGLLKEHNILCIVKPHPMSVKYDNLTNTENIIFATDEWIGEKGITLYQLLGCSDILISDVSSVIIDYLLMDQPIICISTDFQIYKKNRGFYFENVEDWLPNLKTTQAEFFEYLELLLRNEKDPAEEKRQFLKNHFFEYKDDQSTKRLVEKAFSLTK